MIDAPKIVALPQPIKTPSPFQKQVFGPWSTNDPKIQRTIVRTRASSGTVQRKFQATYPPAPTISETLTAITGGWEFSINIVNTKTTSGYNIYSSTTNNPNVAKFVKYQSQPPVVLAIQAIKIQDITSASPFYWVSSVNAAGRESVRVPVSGNPAPTQTTNNTTPTGGSSGLGSGGGAVGGQRGIPAWKRG